MHPLRSASSGKGGDRWRGMFLASTAFVETIICDLDVSQASKFVVKYAVWGMAWLERRRRSCQAAISAG